MADNTNTSMRRPLEGKIAIVTGASRGIGAAICKNLAGKGCSLLMCYTSQSSEQQTIELARTLSKAHSIRAFPAQADLANPDCGSKIISIAKSHFQSTSNELRIDIVINNAGASQGQAVAEITPEAFHKIYNINVLGPLLLMQAILPHLPHDRSGRVVSISSISSTAGLLRQSVYGGSKAALEAMTRTWSRELATRATCNAVNPGPVLTDMWGSVGEDFEEQVRPLLELTPAAQMGGASFGKKRLEESGGKGGRPAQPEEIAGIVAMLCTEDAGWCTGSVVNANGGMQFGR